MSTSVAPYTLIYTILDCKTPDTHAVIRQTVWTPLSACTPINSLDIFVSLDTFASLDTLKTSRHPTRTVRINSAHKSILIIDPKVRAGRQSKHPS